MTVLRAVLRHAFLGLLAILPAGHLAAQELEIAVGRELTLPIADGARVVIRGFESYAYSELFLSAAPRTEPIDTGYLGLRDAVKRDYENSYDAVLAGVGAMPTTGLVFTIKVLPRPADFPPELAGLLGPPFQLIMIQAPNDHFVSLNLHSGLAAVLVAQPQANPKFDTAAVFALRAGEPLRLIYLTVYQNFLNHSVSPGLSPYDCIFSRTKDNRLAYLHARIADLFASPPAGGKIALYPAGGPTPQETVHADGRGNAR